MTRDDINTAFIREFQIGGLNLANAPPNERHERVRRAIYSERKQDLPFRGGPISYAEAFKIWSGKMLDSRTPVADILEDEDGEEL